MHMAATKIKAKIKKVEARSEDTIEEGVLETDIIPKKAKQAPLELDEPEAVIGVLDEKVVEEDPLNPVEPEDEELAEVSLDSEELNPFGDRWEE